MAYFYLKQEAASPVSNRLNGDGAGRVGLHVDAVFIRKWRQRWIVDNDFGSGILGQLIKHVAALIKVELNTHA